MSYHALLDWRLARDLLEVLRHGRLTIDLNGQQRAVDNWAHGYDARRLDGVPAGVRFTHPLLGDFALIGRHPLEASESTFIGDRLAEKLAAAEIAAPDVTATVFVDSFTLDRDPGRVFQLCDATVAQP
jgi:hypothetical protein